MMQSFLENHIYNAREPPPRLRDPAKPMQIICPGFPRTGTESLQAALIKLGYDYTYHGWDVIFEQPNYMQGWVRLCRKKWHGPEDGESNLTAEDFDALMGHSVAVTDAVASVFASDLIRVYPETKVILNGRRDMDAWHRSAINHIASINESWSLFLISRWTWYGFWTWNMYQNMFWHKLFRTTTEQNMGQAVRQNGKWVYREHYDMIRGLVPTERLLEWTVEDGWEPLCEFLGKEVPKEPLPKMNDSAGFQKRVANWHAENQKVLIRNVSTFIAVVAICAGAATWRFAPNRFAAATSGLHHGFDALKGMIRRWPLLGAT